LGVLFLELCASFILNNKLNNTHNVLSAAKTLQGFVLFCFKIRDSGFFKFGLTRFVS